MKLGAIYFLMLLILLKIVIAVSVNKCNMFDTWYCHVFCVRSHVLVDGWKGWDKRGM